MGALFQDKLADCPSDNFDFEAKNVNINATDDVLLAFTMVRQIQQSSQALRQKNKRLLS
jgi:hypothetical protein